MKTADKIKELNETFKKVLNECTELVYIGDRSLREKSGEVDLSEGVKIAASLQKVLEKYRSITGFGRGLAAPQIGENKCVFITYVDNVFKTYINPKILERSMESNLFVESCLSCGILSVDVKRPESITIEYMDEKGLVQKEVANSLVARLLQHEHDHLEGIVNIDKAELGSIQFMVENPLKQDLRKI